MKKALSTPGRDRQADKEIARGKWPPFGDPAWVGLAAPVLQALRAGPCWLSSKGKVFCLRPSEPEKPSVWFVVEVGA